MDCSAPGFCPLLSLEEPVDPVANLFISQFGEKTLSILEHPEQMSRLLNFTSTLNNSAWGCRFRRDSMLRMGQIGDVCRELECSKSGERWVILGFLFHWEQSTALQKEAGES